MKIRTQPPESPSRWDVKSWATSVGIHFLILLLMAVWVLPAIVDSTRNVLSVEMGGSAPDEPLLSLNLPDLKQTGETGPNAEITQMPVDLEPQMVRFAPLPEVSSPVRSLPFDPASVGSESIERRRLETLELEERKEPWDSMRAPSSTSAIQAVADPAQAVSSVTAAIEGEMEQGDTLIVWLLDASISLVSNRTLVAQRMEQFYRRTQTFQTRAADYQGKHLLLNAVVAFGDGSRELVDANRFGARVCQALQKVPPDRTGKENVMAAIQKAVHYYREIKRRRERILFVVITDESGDDTLLLEPTIRLCREAGVAVHVVGPSAVFGAQRGSHLWTARASDGSTGQFLLPVNRGPDTALPERAFLPYWHEALVPPWSQGGVVSADGVPWYGGAYRERLLSGVGPYALTRLSLMTGGSFTILDRGGDGGPFSLEALRDYLPSYESATRYSSDILDSPLRSAVSRVAQLSHDQVDAFKPPRMAFMASRGKRYPFPVNFYYVHPSAFRSRLKRTLIQERRHLEETRQVVALSLQAIGNPEVDWEYEYAKEPSPRWKAWYDLTKGRLLALKVRCDEYEAACDELVDQLQPLSNRVVFHPRTDHYRRTESVEVAKEAERLLQRCVTRNPETPWQALANWELALGLGIRIEQGIVPPPPPPRAATGFSATGGKAPSFSFPNL